jgi:hypothetical protein
VTENFQTVSEEAFSEVRIAPVLCSMHPLCSIKNKYYTISDYTAGSRSRGYQHIHGKEERYPDE